MTFKLEFETGNAIFSEDPDGEVCRILANIQVKVYAGLARDAIRDVNGNTIGKWSYTLDLDEEDEADDAAAERVRHEYEANHVDGFDRDDLGESPDY